MLELHSARLTDAGWYVLYYLCYTISIEIVTRLYCSGESWGGLRGKYCKDSERCCGPTKTDCCAQDEVGLNIIGVPESNSGTKSSTKPLHDPWQYRESIFLNHLNFPKTENTYRNSFQYPRYDRPPVYNIPRETYFPNSIQTSIGNEKNLGGTKTTRLGKKGFGAILGFFGACFAFCCRLFGCKSKTDVDTNAQAETLLCPEYANASAPPPPYTDLEQNLYDSRPKYPVPIPLPYYPLNPPQTTQNSISS